MEDIKSVKFSRIMTLAILFHSIGQFGISLYLPSFSAIHKSLDTSFSLIQLSLTVFLIGFGFSQLFYGPTSDCIGRRMTAYFGVGLFLLGTLICIFSFSIESFLLGRTLQGFGIGCSNVLSYAILRDVYTGRKLITSLAFLTTFNAVSSTIAPVIGGLLQQSIGWRTNFVFLLLYGITMIILIWKALPETNLYLQSGRISIVKLLKDYFNLSKDKHFLGSVFAAALGYSSIIAVLGMTPYLLVSILKLSPTQYGLLITIGTLGFIGGSLLTSYLSHIFGLKKILYPGIGLMFLPALYLAIMGLASDMTALNLVLPITILMVGIGLIIPNACALALSPMAKIAGASSAILGFGMCGMSALVSAVSAYFTHDNQFSMGVILLMLTVLICVCTRFIND